MKRMTWMMASLALMGCGGGLEVTKVDAAYRKPSNVAMFFTVHTRGGEPVPGLEAEDFRIYEDDVLVSPDESQQTIINQEVAAEHYTLLLVDMSGSITESDEVPLIQEAAQTFASTVEDHQQVAVFAFDGSEEIHPIQPFTRSDAAGEAGISRLSGFRAKDPSTNLYGAIVQAIDELDAAMDEADDSTLTFGTVVVFTDGTDRAARVSYADMDEALDEAGNDVFAIGVGNEIDEDVLSDIGRDGHVFVSNSAEIEHAFEDIGEAIVGHTQSYYLLSYCSPARAGTHEVTVEAVTEDASGDLSYEFDAEGFGPNCNPDRPPPFRPEPKPEE
ncbi:MAG: VWA domain-containing protein [Myxococcota bacterium]